MCSVPTPEFGSVGRFPCAVGKQLAVSRHIRQDSLMHCYLCGRPIPSDVTRHRRRVRTGDRSTVSFRTGKMISAHTTYGLRVVCDRCARFLDHQRSTGELRKHLATLGLLFLLGIVLAILR